MINFVRVGNPVTSVGWTIEQVTSVATYTPSTTSNRLTSATSVANTPLGALVIGTGVGREVYVPSTNIVAFPLFHRTFRRFRFELR